MVTIGTNSLSFGVKGFPKLLLYHTDSHLACTIIRQEEII